MDEKLIQRIEEWFDEHQDAMIEDIKRICRIRSVSGMDDVKPYGSGCRKVLDEMLTIGKEHGFIAKNYEYQCGSLCLEEGDMENTIGFWGHLDVVPEGDGWEHTEPYNPVLKDGYLIGRGVSDNKGPTVATMYILQCLHELQIPMKHHLKMFLGCDEEVGMRDTEYYAANYPNPGMSIIADSGFPVCYGEKGILEANLYADEPIGSGILEFYGGIASNMVPDKCVCRLAKTDVTAKAAAELPDAFEVAEEEDSYVLKVQGVSKHTASPEGGVNAIRLMTEALLNSGILKEEDQKKLAFMSQINSDFYGEGLGVAFEDEISGKLTCVGSMANIKEGKIYLHINIRYSITKNAEELEKQIADICKEHGFTMDVVMNSAPNYYPKEKPAVELLTRVYNEVAGDDKQPFVMGGGTYARKLPNAFAYGMGLPNGVKPPEGMFAEGHGGAHTPDEYLCIENLRKGMKIFAIGLLEMNEFPL